MSTNPTDDVETITSIDSSATSPDPELIGRFVQTQEVDISDLVPSQVNTGIKLQERQEETRSNLANSLIKILASTLIASFSLVSLLIFLSIFS